MTLRHIIHIGVKPVLYEIATVMSASLVNVRLFGNYKVDCLIVLGNVFSISNTSLCKEYTVLLKAAVDAIIRQKEKDTSCFILHENFPQFLRITPYEKPYMLHSLITGNLQQVSSSTYCIIANLSDSDNNSHKILYENKHGITYTMNDFESKTAVVALQRGQTIRSMDFFKNYKFIHNGEKNINQRYTLRLGKINSLLDCIDTY